MKYKTFILALTFIAASLIASKVYSQSRIEMNKVELDRNDSVDTATRNEAKVLETKDQNTMANAKVDRKETKAKAKAAKRIERDANDAAKQSRYAVTSERKAQKSRKQANDQAEKASKARDKSDNN
jgi:Na+-transporting NADH:ubiquinone oxidoreductase subunit NqrC